MDLLRWSDRVGEEMVVMVVVCCAVVMVVMGRSCWSVVVGIGEMVEVCGSRIFGSVGSLLVLSHS